MVVGDFAENTEVAVIGAGPGGYVAAIRLAQLGKEVTLISDEALPGGTCLHRGCIPSKAFIHVAALHRQMREGEKIGLHAGELRLDFPQVQAWKKQLLESMGKGIAGLLKQNGVQVLAGRARFSDPHNLEIVSEDRLQRLTFGQAIIATGSRPATIPNFALNGETILSSTELLSLKQLPKSLIILGGGYIGLELGMAFAEFGTQVSIIEATAQLLPGLDAELLRPVKKRLESLSVAVHLETKAESVNATTEGVALQLQTSAEPKTLTAEKLLLAVGRKPNTEDLQLQNAGIALDAKGFIPINERCQTKIPHLFAIGDVAGGLMLAHKASAEAKVAAAVIAGQPDAFDQRIPAVVFTDPEIATVGLTEKSAKEKGIATSTGMMGFGALGRAQILGEKDGWIKVVAEQGSGRVLGVQIVGPHASDLIAEATLGLEMGAMLEDFAKTIHAHPSLPETLQEAMESALGLPIHRIQRKK